MAKFKMTGGKDAHDSLEPLRTSFKAGSVVFEEGDLGLAMYVIESGEVEIRKRLGRKSEVLAVLGKGDFFGEMCMLEDEVPRSATALAKTDVDAVMIDRSAFTFILKHNPEITIRIMRKLVRRLRQTTEMLEEALGHAVDLEGPGAADGPKGPQDPRARLVEVTTGLAFPLAKEGETTVGRIDPVTGIHPDVDLTPVDGKRSISRRHARLRREADGTFTVVEDVGTMNGTFVNGTRVSAGKPHPVEPGDTVMFGTIQCRFEIDPSQA
ncbi:MAG TPA: cyclic nucleotide-binding domain-containing protein [Candidatus Sulfomarinibacteraceae bacterium]|nr:cyclic nucleotide-binding domain-containing protein [Candidatus Sulfomarinibacteraceae bacterium]